MLGGMIALPYDGRLVWIGFKMTIQTVNGDIEGAILKPFDAKIIQIIADITDEGWRFYPVDHLSALGPKIISSFW